MKEDNKTKELDRLFQRLIESKSFGYSLMSGRKANCIHHCINRKQSDILRWDWRNAIPLHHNPFEEEPEHNNKNAEQKTEFDWGLPNHIIEHLNKYKNIRLKDYLIQEGLSKEDFIEIRKKELLNIILNK